MRDNLQFEAARAREDGECFDTEPLTWRDAAYIAVAVVVVCGLWWMGWLS